MFRTTTMAALALALLSSAAMAQTGPAGRASGPPAQMSGQNNSYDGRDSYDDRDDGPPPPRVSDSQSADNQAQDQRSRDMFCRRDAAARTGYVTPGQAAHDSKTSAQVGGTLGGAALGAIVGSASHSAGVGALIGAGAGLVAGSVIGSDNAHRAAADVEHAYSDAYYACMDEADDRSPGDRDYAYGPPPPAYYGPSPYYYPPYYGPSISLGFGFGGNHGWRGGHGFHHR